MKVDVWLQAIMMAPPRICGVGLLPFSLFHYYLLEKMDCPYLPGAKADPTVADLLETIQVCSRTWEQNRDALFHRESRLSMFKWSMRQHRLAKKGRISFDTASHSLSQYIRDYLYVPEVNERVEDPEKKAPYVIGPEAWHYVVSLMKVGMSESEAWNCPVNRAVCLFLIETESRGVDIIKSEYDSHMGRFEKRAQAALKAGDMESVKTINAEQVAFAGQWKAEHS